MADLEIRKHAKLALKNVIKRDGKGFFLKLKEFVLEIFIIVFAVSLSIWFHGLSEKKHQSDEVKTFLTDLKSDLLADKAQIIKENKKFEEYYKKDTIQVKRKTQSIKLDSINADEKNQKVFYIRISRYTNSGNYQGFKSSGNIAYIENKPLKKRILQYYEQDIKSLESLENVYNTQLEKVMGIAFDENKKKLANNNYFLKVYKELVFYNYNEVVAKINIILIEIDKELK